MAKSKSQKQQSKRGQRRRSEMVLDQRMSIPTQLYPGRDPTTPGRAHLRAIVELKGGQQALAFSYVDFNTWFAYARNILTPYHYFRVAEASVQVTPSGGAASLVTTAFNISNDVKGDTTALSILNDDYCAVSNALVRPVLRPPRSFWTMGARTWYNALDPVSGVPTESDCIAGAISLDTAGAGAGVACGYILVECVLEFHTLG